MRALVGTYVRALTCSHMSVYGLCMCGRACVCASGHVRVFMRAWVRECVCACMLACAHIRMYDYCSFIIVERGSSVGECRTRNRERGVRIPFDTV